MSCIKYISGLSVELFNGWIKCKVGVSVELFNG